VRVEHPAGLPTCWRDADDVLVAFPALDSDASNPQSEIRHPQSQEVAA
jgi:hypothetical protein